MTNSLLRDNLHPMTFASLSQGLRRDSAPVPFINIYATWRKIPAIYQTCTPDDASHVRTFGATPPARNKNCTLADSYTGRQKARPRFRFAAAGQAPLSCHRDIFLPKVSGPSRWTSGNMPPLQSGSSLSRHTMSGLNARPSLLPGR